MRAQYAPSSLLAQVLAHRRPCTAMAALTAHHHSHGRHASMHVQTTVHREVSTCGIAALIGGQPGNDGGRSIMSLPQRLAKATSTTIANAITTSNQRRGRGKKRRTAKRRRVTGYRWENKRKGISTYKAQAVMRASPHHLEKPANLQLRMA